MIQKFHVHLHIRRALIPLDKKGQIYTTPLIRPSALSLLMRNDLRMSVHGAKYLVSHAHIRKTRHVYKNTLLVVRKFNVSHIYLIAAAVNDSTYVGSPKEYSPE